MNRRFVIMIVAIVAFAGLYLYDRDNSSEMVLPGKVTGVKSQSPDEGADIWLVTVEIGGQTLTLSPLSVRPNIALGDTICVSRITRPGQPAEHRRTTGNASC